MIDSAELIPLGALAEVQAAAGPPYANSRKGSAKKVLIILAAVIVPLVIAGVVAVVLWTRGGPAGGGKKGPGLGNWAWYAPDDANSVAFVHVGKLAEANLAGALRGNLPGIGDIDALKVTDLQEVFAVSYGRLGTQVVVFRTGSDKPLKDLASQGTFATAEGVEYAVLNPQQGRKCLARTEAATYCLAPNEAEMKATLKRFAGRKSPRLKKDLQEVVDRVSRNDHYRAMLLPTLMGFRAGTAYGGGFSARAGSQVQYENLILFGDSKNAALYADGLRKQMEVERSVRPKPGSRITDLQKHFERRAKLKESAKINQSDEWVRVDGSIDAQDIRDVGSEAIELLLGGRAF